MASQLQTASVLHLMQEDAHPEKEIFKAVGDISDIELTETAILVGIYIQQGKTKGGLITSTMSIESAYQGKVGVVLKMPNAELPEVEAKSWGGRKNLPKVGQWVLFHPDNGQLIMVRGKDAQMSDRLKDLGIELHGWPCRVIEAKYLLGRIKEPRSVV